MDGSGRTMPFRDLLNIEATVVLNNGVAMPILGFGTWRLQGSEAYHGVRTALDQGVRLIDTASMYGNEAEVGRAVRESGLDREEVFVTTKLWAHEHGRDEAKIACNNSLERLGLDYVDLFLIHWPTGGRNEETWEGMVELMEEGKVRSIGVSNFGMELVRALAEATGVMPAVDQVEFGPYYHDDQLLEECSREGVQLEAYSPLRSTDLNDRALTEVARRHRRSPAQVVLRWCLQKGVVPLFKTSHESRIREDASVFDFTLSLEEMERLDNLS